MLDPIAVSIPGFFALIGVEVLVGGRLGRLGGRRPLYRWADALTDLGCGLLSQVAGLATGGIVVGAYAAVHAHAAAFRFPHGPLGWALAFVLVDLAYYVWHRASHRVAFLWAAHVVHHQSEDYNLAVALRQSSLTNLTSLPFNLPLAVLGIEPEVFVLCSALNTLYQFWIHTRLVGSLGPLEWILNTPSHHRVHHGIDPGYVDRNHAGVFIGWDRLLGTFASEDQEPAYGTIDGFRSGHALWANIEPWVALVAKARRCRGLWRFAVWLLPPEWSPTGAVPIPVPSGDLRWSARVGATAIAWTATGLAACAAILTWLLLNRSDMAGATVAMAGLWIVWTVTNWGPLFSKHGVRPSVGWWASEGARVLAGLICVARALP